MQNYSGVDRCINKGVARKLLVEWREVVRSRIELLLSD